MLAGHLGGKVFQLLLFCAILETVAFAGVPVNCASFLIWCKSLACGGLRLAI